MRLFRRSLLCLVVGVTAFGVAGWGFRPRANWTYDLGENVYAHLAESAQVPTPHDPIWLFVASRKPKTGYDPKVAGRIWAISSDGRLLREEALPVGYPIVASDGLLSMGFPRDEKLKETSRFTLVEPNTSTAVTQEFQGAWLPTGDGLHAFQLQATEHEVNCSVIELRTGALAGKVTLDRTRFDVRSRDNVAVTPNGQAFAVSATSNGARGGPLAIWLFDVATGKATAEVLPSNLDEQTRGRARFPRFNRSGSELEFTWYANEQASTGTKGRFRLHRDQSATLEGESDEADDFGPNPTASQPCAWPLPPSADAVWISHQVRSEDGLRLWLAPSAKQCALWLSVDDGLQLIESWTKYPGEAFVRPVHFDFFSDPGPGFIWDQRPLSEFVPDQTAFVVAVREPPWVEGVPGAFENLLPENSPLRASQTAVRWHDWKRNEWRTVGDITGLGEFQVRSNTLITFRHTEGGSLLQSWPLPPRDPKWPALGVAALCAAGTWWACARRYRRRMNRAENPAVTA